METSLSGNLEYLKSATLLSVHPTPAVTDSLQFINLPCSVSQSSHESETKSDGNWNSTEGVSVEDNKWFNKKSKQVEIEMCFKLCKAIK